jgi:hypothetical protein
VQVGPFTYDVKVTRRMPDELLGQTDKANHRITLHPDQGALSLRAVMLHEVIHAACNVLDLDSGDGQVEERVATALAPTLLGVLRANPGLVAWLVE